MPRKKENRQADGGQRRNLIRIGPDLMTVPQMAREYTPIAIHTLACLAASRDPDSVPLGATPEEIKAAEPVEVAYKDQIRAAEGVLTRGVGKPLTFEEMRALSKLEDQNTHEIGDDELRRIAAEGAQDAEFTEI